MANYCSLIIQPPGYNHSKCFIEIARAVDEALNVLGAYDPKGIPIVFGAHLEKKLPTKAIIFNSEQVFSWDYLQTLRKHKVWDYSKNNIAVLKSKGIEARYCPVGYMPSMSTITPATKDIDVLIYGSQNERRMRVFRNLKAAGIKAYYAFDVYGAERDMLIARSKIVLNIHYYEEGIHEIFRTSHLMANKKCIVSEYGKDFLIENPLEGALRFSAYEILVEECADLLKGDLIPEYEKASFGVFSRTSMVASIKDLL